MNTTVRVIACKLIICGGRDYVFDSKDEAWLDMLRVTEGVSMVIEGGATGADFCGGMWARNRGIFVHTEKADWNQFGKKAGPIRNRKMAKLADACAVFPGGKGTADMEKAAREAGLKLFIAPMRL